MWQQQHNEPKQLLVMNFLQTSVFNLLSDLKKHVFYFFHMLLSKFPKLRTNLILAT